MQPPRVLLLYSTVFGLSRRICERMQSQLADAGVAATVVSITDPSVDPSAFDSVVVGASIRQGKHNPTVMDFVRRHAAALQSRPSAFFSVNLVARKPTKNTPETNPYLQRFIAGCPQWKPALLGVFAGELDYSRYGRFEKQLMRFVMRINKGPTDPGTRVTFTDWGEVERYAARVAALVQRAPQATRGALATMGSAAPAAAAATPATAEPVA